MQKKTDSMLSETSPVVNKHSDQFAMDSWVSGICCYGVLGFWPLVTGQQQEAIMLMPETWHRLLPRPGSAVEHFDKGLDTGSHLAFGKIALIHTVHFEV